MQALGRIWIFVFMLLGLANKPALAQDTLMSYLVNRIAEQQVTSDAYFLPGIFPSYISNSYRFSEKQKDNNIFYNALIDYTLRNIQDALPKASRVEVDLIQKNALPLYAAFKNRKGRNTYNFWRTDTTFTFPYTWWIKKLKKNPALPDDLDDTVLSLMALDASDSTAAAVHQLMQQYVNSGDKNKARSIPEDYRQFAAYSTWFGVKVPVVLDMCVLANVLTFVQRYNLSWTAHDSASLNFIVAAIKRNDHINHATEVAPYYGNTSVILYHLARLMSVRRIPALETIKERLAIDAAWQWQSTNNVLEKIILSTALMKWGYIPPDVPLPSIPNIKAVIEENDLSFFIGNIPSYLPNLQRSLLQRIGWGNFYHYCPAYNNVLMLEYLVWRKKYQIQN